jgi:hypothetical protein
MSSWEASIVLGFVMDPPLMTAPGAAAGPSTVTLTLTSRDV